MEKRVEYAVRTLKGYKAECEQRLGDQERVLSEDYLVGCIGTALFAIRLLEGRVLLGIDVPSAGEAKQ